MVIRRPPTHVHFTILESPNKPGSYEIYHRDHLILRYRRQKKGIEIVVNELGIPDEEVKLHIEAYADDAEAIMIYLSRLKFRSHKRLDRIMRRCVAFMDEDDLLALYRQIRYLEDVHK